MKVANIISKTKINVSEYFNVVDSMSDIIDGLPTLIVGFDYVNQHYPDFDIMEREVEPNLYWIFKKIENRDEFENGLTWFTQKIFYDLFKTLDYVYVDFMLYGKSTIKKIIRKIYSIDVRISYQYKDMIYIYGDNLIFGIDLRLLRYMEIDVEHIRKKIQLKSHLFLSEKDISKENKHIIQELDNQIRYTPYLYYLNQE